VLGFLVDILQKYGKFVAWTGFVEERKVISRNIFNSWDRQNVLNQN
jgi:hypothetical protein